MVEEHRWGEEGGREQHRRGEEGGPEAGARRAQERVEVEERLTEVDGLEIHWRVAGDAPILYLHGAPTASWDWLPFLERSGGVAPDLPGFGSSAKPANYDYSIRGYDDFVERFAAAAGLERLSLVVHDWGGAGLVFAQRFPERIERLVVFSCLPLLPGYQWHRVARIFRTPLIGELAMGFTTKGALRRSLPAAIAERAWEDFDHGTQRAMLKLYRATDTDMLPTLGARLGELRCPALVLWPSADPYIASEFGQRYADALGGPVEHELTEGGHWSWHERPELVERAVAFLR